MAKLAELFPTKACTRCGGSGRYSYNTIDGDRCYGCQGTGRMWATKKVAAQVEAYRLAARRQKEAQASALAVGDRVVSDLSSRLAGQGWATIVSIVETGDACGWSLGTAGERTVTATYRIVELDNGLTRRIAGNQIVRRFSAGVDPTPYVEAAR